MNHGVQEILGNIPELAPDKSITVLCQQIGSLRNASRVIVKLGGSCFQRICSSHIRCGVFGGVRHIDAGEAPFVAKHLGHGGIVGSCGDAADPIICGHGSQRVILAQAPFKALQANLTVSLLRHEAGNTVTVGLLIVAAEMLEHTGTALFCHSLGLHLAAQIGQQRILGVVFKVSSGVGCAVDIAAG